LNGLVFKDDEEFISKYKQIFEDPELKNRLIQQGLKDIEQRYNIEQEKKLFESLVSKITTKYYQMIKVLGVDLKIFNI